MKELELGVCMRHMCSFLFLSLTGVFFSVYKRCVENSTRLGNRYPTRHHHRIDIESDTTGPILKLDVFQVDWNPSAGLGLAFQDKYYRQIKDTSIAYSPFAGGHMLLKPC